jgi:deferrochelatase/peroxidase EfeB
VSGDAFRLSRRQLLGSSATASAALLAAASGGSGEAAAAPAVAIPFRGAQQAGIATPTQDHLALATWDLVPGSSVRDLRGVLDQWTAASERLTQGRPLPGATSAQLPPSDTGEAAGLGPARLTLTLGVGPGLFEALPELVPRRPAALADLPAFKDDQLDPSRSGGQLCIQACADDPQVAFHAVRTLSRLGAGVLVPRFVQQGFGRTSATGSGQSTQRNLLGFKDGTNNIRESDQRGLDEHVLVRGGDQPWMEGGTYLVYRRIRARLEFWQSVALREQEAAIGRRRSTGAPLTGVHEDDPVDLGAMGPHGLPVIPHGAHIRVAAPSSNGGIRMLRRGFGFADGVDPSTGELDAGLAFIAFVRAPDRFTAVQRQLAAGDQLHHYLVHRASGVYACPRGLRPGESWADLLFGSGRRGPASPTR